MRRSSEPEERAQFTVAELLARYGEPAPTSGRRRRRAVDDPYPVVDTAAEAAVQPTQADLFQRHSTRVDSTHGDSTHVDSTQPRLNGRASQEWAPAVAAPPSGWAPAVAPPSVVARRAPLAGMAPIDGPATDQLPRLDPLPVDPLPGSSRPPVNAQFANAQFANAQPPAGLGTATSAIPEQNDHAGATDEAQAQESGSPLWEWAVMVSQIGIGVVGGAALWLICEWLWQRIPAVALIMALAVITGLVWVVRRVRRAEDLQTTVIAVLVGLFVTVSPAALLLVGR